ncbi:DEAD/DEAH box helicase [Anaeromusa sp.]|uniref:DEAD/DEAH box helicase n=1 Tax=Anaeromusa sp. TaxID=1872520 RepID=UPI00262B27F1|nr:DEAD/DEAH box helicase [Anaeromusa sp.]MDD3157463.1 DEAD/DEAH box helicase [Anaeromusa sp.]
MQLRDYQSRGINDIRARFVQGMRSVCFVAPCGAGKTLLMAYMAQRAASFGNRTLFLVHRKELIQQAAGTFQALNMHFGVIAPGYPQTGDSIQIGSVQTVARRLGGLKDFQLIILDECHHATAATWMAILQYFEEAKIVGLTATPARLNGQGLGSVFETLVMGPPAKELICRGFLAPYKYYAPPVMADLGNIRIKMGDFDAKEVEVRVNKSAIIGDAVAHYLKLAIGRQGIAYCASIAHSQNTAASFRAAGVSAVHIDGTTPAAEREQTVAAFRRGEIKVLCNVDLFGEGVDVPAMEAVMLLRPTQSLTLFIQQSMRGMRADRNNPDKLAIILDHVGNVMRHGLPDAEREWSLEGREKKFRQKQQALVKIKVCQNCFAAHDPAPACPFCGFQYPIAKREIEEEEGELKEFSPVEKTERRIEVGRATSMDDLIRIAKERGYKNGWIKIQAKLKGIRG